MVEVEHGVVSDRAGVLVSVRRTGTKNVRLTVRYVGTKPPLFEYPQGTGWQSSGWSSTASGPPGKSRDQTWRRSFTLRKPRAVRIDGVTITLVSKPQRGAAHLEVDDSGGSPATTAYADGTTWAPDVPVDVPLAYDYANDDEASGASDANHVADDAPARNADATATTPKPRLTGWRSWLKQ
jgi:hypothetical protein